MALIQNSMGLLINDPRTTGTYDERYAAATTDAQKQAIVAERDAANAKIAAENDAWHKAHGTGPYATPGGGGAATVTEGPDPEREDAKAYLAGLLRQYGLGSLSGEIDRLVNDWGNRTGVIAEKLRSTEPYKVRFKGLTALQSKGVTDVANEAEYIQLESRYRQAFREAGLQSFLGDAGAQTEIDSIAKLAGDFSLSVNEVTDRITDAQRVVADTPQEVRDSLQRYYNVDPATLVSYVLDPTKTASQVNRLANTAIIGGYGTKAGLNLDLTAAGGASDLAQGQDINLDVLQTDLAAAREIRDSTKRLAEIEQKDLTDTEAFQAQLKTSTDAEQKVKKLQSSERGRFGGTSAFGKGALSRPNVF